MIVPNTCFDKKRPTKMMIINPIGKQNYFEGVGCDKNIFTHSLWMWTFYFVLYVWYFMDLPNFPSNISFGYYHCRTCILRTLFPQCYGNLCKSNVKIFCAETFSTSQNKFWKMKSYTFDGFGNKEIINWLNSILNKLPRLISSNIFRSSNWWWLSLIYFKFHVCVENWRGKPHLSSCCR